MGAAAGWSLGASFAGWRLAADHEGQADHSPTPKGKQESRGLTISPLGPGWPWKEKSVSAGSLHPKAPALPSLHHPLLICPCLSSSPVLSLP